MKRQAVLGLMLAGSVMLGGCVAALVPAAAAVKLGRDALDPQQAASRSAAQPTRPSPTTATSQAQADVPVPASAQYLYASAEASAISQQVYATLDRFLRERVDERVVGSLVMSMVPQAGSTPEDPRFRECGDRPLALVMDIDETLVLNAGYESDSIASGEGYSSDRWQRWEQTGIDRLVAVPGAVRSVSNARALGLTVVFISNRSALNAAYTAAALERLGFGASEPGKTLLLSTGDSGKDMRRQAVEQTYCVIAMVGDQLGDFSDLFNAPALDPAQRRALAESPRFAALWGDGWFILPNPVYGPAIKGGMDAVFPAATRWRDPARAPAPTVSPSPVSPAEKD
ncbi:5'-nucleotidase, lipoprotein e(P4) family [Sphingomonas sp. CJ99]